MPQTKWRDSPCRPTSGLRRTPGPAQQRCSRNPHVHCHSSSSSRPSSRQPTQGRSSTSYSASFRVREICRNSSNRPLNHGVGEVDLGCGSTSSQVSRVMAGLLALNSSSRPVRKTPGSNRGTSLHWQQLREVRASTAGAGSTASMTAYTNSTEEHHRLVGHLGVGESRGKAIQLWQWWQRIKGGQGGTLVAFQDFYTATLAI